LLHNDANAASLFANNPFSGRPPRYIRAVLYKYSFAKPGNTKRLWWNRERKGLWLPPMSVNDSSLVTYIKGMGWIK
jgi:hypothetical protein